MTLFLWLVGYLFTLGFYRRDKRDEELGSLFYVLVVVTWPLVLGHSIRKLFP